jgi:hypothetical protein
MEAGSGRVSPSRRQLDALGACLDAGSVKVAAYAFGVTYDRMRHLLHEIYRDLEVRTFAQAVAVLYETMPGWRVRRRKMRANGGTG